jgi:hypothetical protein
MAHEGFMPLWACDGARLLTTVKNKGSEYHLNAAAILCLPRIH